MQIYTEGNIYIHIYVRENTNVERNTHRSNAKTQPNIFPAKKIALSRIRKRLRKWETRRAKERERQRPQYIKVLVPRQLSEDTGGSRTAHSRSLSLSLSSLHILTSRMNVVSEFMCSSGCDFALGRKARLEYEAYSSLLFIVVFWMLKKGIYHSFFLYL